MLGVLVKTKTVLVVKNNSWSGDLIDKIPEMTYFYPGTIFLILNESKEHYSVAPISNHHNLVIYVSKEDVESIGKNFREVRSILNAINVPIQ